jgi:ferrous iron transport protein B
VILAISVLLWAAMTFPQLPRERAAMYAAEREALAARAADPGLDQAARQLLAERLALVDNTEREAALRHSLAGRTGAALETITAPAGFEWRTNIALVGGFAAKEVIVSTLGTAYSLGETDPEDAKPLADRLRVDPHWSRLHAVALIVFIMLYAPCFVTVVAIRSEAGSWRWAAFSVVFNTALAYALAVAVFQGGRLLALG